MKRTVFSMVLVFALTMSLAPTDAQGMAWPCKWHGWDLDSHSDFDAPMGGDPVGWSDPDNTMMVDPDIVTGGGGWFGASGAATGDTPASAAVAPETEMFCVRWIDPDGFDGGGGGGAAYDVHCDMTTDGGGWTRVYCDMTTDGGGWTLVIGYWNAGTPIDLTPSALAFDPTGDDFFLWGGVIESTPGGPLDTAYFVVTDDEAGDVLLQEFSAPMPSAASGISELGLFTDAPAGGFDDLKTAVPEPASAALLMVCFGAILKRRRK